MLTDADMSVSPLDRAKTLMGGTAALARALGITRAAVSQWNRVPASRVLQVELVTGGRVARHELRPDLYPACDVMGPSA